MYNGTRASTSREDKDSLCIYIYIIAALRDGRTDWDYGCLRRPDFGTEVPECYIMGRNGLRLEGGDCRCYDYSLGL